MAAGEFGADRRMRGKKEENKNQYKLSREKNK